MIEEPKTKKNPYSPSGGQVTTHPAFAAISASRVSGATMLNGSDFEHRSFITIKVARAEMHRDHSRDSLMADGAPLIEVNISEAQWATFVSSMNVGTGVACTLKSFNGLAVPELPPPTDRRETFRADALKRLDSAVSSLDELRQQLTQTNLSKKAQDDFTRKIASISQQITDNLPYVAKQFDKHMETTTERAKIEINAHALNATMLLGIQQLRKGESLSVDEAPESIKLR